MQVPWLLSSCAGAPGFGDFGFPDGSTWNLETTADTTAFEPSKACNGGRSFKILAGAKRRDGEYGEWLTASPAQISLAGGLTPAKAMLVNPRAYSSGYSFRYLYSERLERDHRRQ